MHMPRKPGTPPTVTGRVLAILDALGAGDPVGLSLVEISRRADPPLSTTFRLVKELVEARAVARDDQLRYRIGPRLRVLGG